MAIYHAPEDPNKSTFAGGTIGQALAKHRLKEQKPHEDDKKEKMKEHLDKAHEHLSQAKQMHESKGEPLSEEQESDPHEVNESAGAAPSLAGTYGVK